MAATKTETLPSKLQRVLFGKPIPTAREHHERLSLFLGLPVFASDALSSAAYATEAIIGILMLASVAAMGAQPWITGAICVLYVLVVVSYQQTVRAYPSGGGSYIVAADNLGEKPAVVAASALLIDYVLTVSVSIAAGVAALVSAFPALHSALVPMSVGAIGLIIWANLRGVRESGMMFALPSYGFVIGMIVMIVVGVTRVWGTPHPVQNVVAETGALGSEAHWPMLFILLRSFAAGCVALTGVEAISNGVPAFKKPEATNAAKCLRWLAVMMVAMFIGTGFLVQYLPQIALLSSANQEYRTVVSQIAAFVFGPNSAGFFYIQLATATILILAANTAFADFPRLASILARDGYLPRPLARLGDRLVFQNGIIVLGILAIALILYFKGQLDLLLPLYAVGVFTAFTLSQISMVSHWLKVKERGWLRRAAINGLGGLVTGVVAIVILSTKFVEGAWIVLGLMGLVSWGLLSIKRRYAAISEQLATEERTIPTPAAQTAILLVPRLHRGILSALDYALSLHADVRALHVTLDRNAAAHIRQEWDNHGGAIPLVIIESPYRSLIVPMLDYIDQMLEDEPDRTITVVVAEAVSSKWRHWLFQENVANQLKRALGKRKNVVVSNIRYFLK